jgi:hypothetical protein
MAPEACVYGGDVTMALRKQRRKERKERRPFPEGDLEKNYLLYRVGGEGRYPCSGELVRDPEFISSSSAGLS